MSLFFLRAFVSMGHWVLRDIWTDSFSEYIPEFPTSSTGPQRFWLHQRYFAFPLSSPNLTDVCARGPCQRVCLTAGRAARSLPSPTSTPRLCWACLCCVDPAVLSNFFPRLAEPNVGSHSCLFDWGRVRYANLILRTVPVRSRCNRRRVQRLKCHVRG